MELTPLQIDLFKSLIGLTLTFGIVGLASLGLYQIIKILPTSFIERVI